MRNTSVKRMMHLEEEHSPNVDDSTDIRPIWNFKQCWADMRELLLSFTFQIRLSLLQRSYWIALSGKDSNNQHRYSDRCGRYCCRDMTVLALRRLVQERQSPLFCQLSSTFYYNRCAPVEFTILFILSSHRTLAERVGPTVLVLAPTQELAEQIHKETRKYLNAMRHRDIRRYTLTFRNATTSAESSYSICVRGGTRVDEQVKEVQKRRYDIVVATPGRLVDLSRRRALRLEHVTFLVRCVLVLSVDTIFVLRCSTRRIACWTRAFPRRSTTFAVWRTKIIKRERSNIPFTLLRRPVLSQCHDIGDMAARRARSWPSRYKGSIPCCRWHAQSDCESNLTFSHHSH